MEFGYDYMSQDISSIYHLPNSGHITKFLQYFYQQHVLLKTLELKNNVKILHYITIYEMLFYVCLDRKQSRANYSLKLISTFAIIKFKDLPVILFSHYIALHTADHALNLNIFPLFLSMIQCHRQQDTIVLLLVFEKTLKWLFYSFLILAFFKILPIQAI